MSARQFDRMLDATKPVPFQGDGYPARNRAALDRKIRETFESIEGARKDGDKPMVAALQTQLRYFKAARANNDGQPFSREFA